MINLTNPIIRERFEGGKIQSFFTAYMTMLDDAVCKCVGQFEDGIRGWVLLVPKSVDNVIVGYIALEWGII